MNHEIEQAIYELRANAARYARSERYYRGDHDLAFATEKFQNAFGTMFREFALNLCPAVCDAVRDKLKIVGFGTGSAGSETPKQKGNGEFSKLSSEARRIWDANRMQVRSGDVHKEALKNGDAYVIVWPDENGRAALHPNRAENIAVFCDEHSPGAIRLAAKYWRRVDKRFSLILYYPDRIEKYLSASAADMMFPEAKDLEPSGPAIANPFGRVPVFHFANNSDFGALGTSELAAAMPVQDGLNKSVLDMLVAMEYSAYRQRWAAGIEFEEDPATGQPKPPFRAGIDHLWITSNPNASFGDFNSADLEQFLKVKESFRVDMACVTGTPLHYLQPSTKGFPSGESLRKAETRFIAKVRDRQANFGQAWSDVMSFALMAEGHGRDISIVTHWEDAAAVSEREILENILLKKEIGLSTEQALREAGYASDEIRSAESSN